MMLPQYPRIAPICFACSEHVAYCLCACSTLCQPHCTHDCDHTARNTNTKTLITRNKYKCIFPKWEFFKQTTGLQRLTRASTDPSQPLGCINNAQTLLKLELWIQTTGIRSQTPWNLQWLAEAEGTLFKTCCLSAWVQKPQCLYQKNTETNKSTEKQPTVYKINHIMLKSFDNSEINVEIPFNSKWLKPAQPGKSWSN